MCCLLPDVEKGSMLPVAYFFLKVSPIFLLNEFCIAFSCTREIAESLMTKFQIVFFRNWESFITTLNREPLLFSKIRVGIFSNI